ncbi:MAG: hypothetical protein H6532_08225 [Thermoleophilales bacterium]|nr:hypothetical protein [Thermoleophilales bacterium]
MENLPAGFRSIITALTLCLALGLALAPSASAADYTPQQRKEYFDSGKYANDLATVARSARRWIIRRTQPTLGKVRACRKAGYRIGKKDPGVNPNADYSIPVNVPKHQQPDRIVSAPEPGPDGQPAVLLPDKNIFKPVRKVKKITRKACAKMKRLAIAMDMDETVASSFAYGSDRVVYDNAQAGANLATGTQTRLRQMYKVYKLAKNRGVAAFIITARPEIPSLREITEQNLKDIGYTTLAGVYLKPHITDDTATVKNSERAEIVKRRGYRIIAMFGDQPTDLEGGFFERGFKYQSPYAPDEG